MHYRKSAGKRTPSRGGMNRLAACRFGPSSLNRALAFFPMPHAHEIPLRMRGGMSLILQHLQKSFWAVHFVHHYLNESKFVSILFGFLQCRL